MDGSKDEKKNLNQDLKYGFGSCTPRWLQLCLSPKMAAFWICWFALVQGFVVNGINNVNTSTLERRYQLPSSRVGLISSSYDIVAAILIIPLTYYGAHAHQPRMLAIGALIMSIGSFVMALPQFTVGDYKLGQRSSDRCDVYGNATVCEETDPGLPNYLYVFMLGQGLHGVGGTMLYTLGVVFIDTHCKTKDNPIYQAAFGGCAVFGPAMGYVFGGIFLQRYVDFYKADPDELGVSPSDPRWVGAWWVGFATASVLALTIFLGLLPYPKELPNAQKIRESRKSLVHHDGSELVASRPGFGRSIRDFPTSLKLIVCNPTMMLITISTASEGMIVSGFATFMPKFFQEMYNLSAGNAAALSGLLAVAGAAGGSILGGVVAKKANLSVTGILKMCFGLVLGAMAITVVIISMWCDPPGEVGVTVEYPNGTVSRTAPPNMTSNCNGDCHCTLISYEPICGVNNVQYFSPCHAGCMSSFEDGGVRKYSNCSCLSEWKDGTQARAGRCPLDCTTLPGFVVLFFCLILCTFTITVPTTLVALRCVPDSQRSLATGIRSLIGRCLGSVPGPLIMGALWDNACRVWQSGCDKAGSCWVYNRWTVAISILGLGIAVRVVSASMYFAAIWSYKPPPSHIIGEVIVETVDSDKNTNSQDITDYKGHGEMNGEVFTHM